MTIIQYIIRDVATGCIYTGAYPTLAYARKRARQLVQKYGGAVRIFGSDGTDEESIELVSDGAWK